MDANAVNAVDREDFAHAHAGEDTVSDGEQVINGTTPPTGAKKKKKKKKGKKKKTGDADAATAASSTPVLSSFSRNAMPKGESMDGESGHSRLSGSLGDFTDADVGSDDGNVTGDPLDDDDFEDEADEDADFSSESEEEDDASYKPGGYHRIRIGEVYNGRFTVVDKLGWGHFSTVWKCHDRETGELVAMKVQKSARHYREAAQDEIELLECTVKAARKLSLVDVPLVKLIDSFDVKGPNGLHICMVFEMMGDNLLTLIKHYNYRGVPMPLVKTLTRDMLEGLAFLHSNCQIIHTDLKPENVLLSHRIPRLLRLRRSEFWRDRRERVRELVGDSTNKLASVSALVDTDNQPTSGNESALSREQKKKLKKKQKKKRQKQQKKQTTNDVTGPGVDDEDDMEDEVSNDQLVETVADELAALHLNGLASEEPETESKTLVDAVFLNNFQVDADDRVDIVVDGPVHPPGEENEDDWVHIPAEHVARAMVILPPNRIASKRRKEAEYTIEVEADNRATGKPVKTSFVLRYFDRVDNAFMTAMDDHVLAIGGEPTGRNDPLPPLFKIWKLEFDARYAVSVLEFVETLFLDVAFVSCSADSLLSYPGFALPKLSETGSAVQPPASLVLQGMSLPGGVALAPLRPLHERLAPWTEYLTALQRAPSFDMFALRGKICDLGNACWTFKHFTDDIQTRQYRSPEVILGKKYDTSADIWSMACFVFELLTGDLLFDPKNGRNFNHYEDHLAQMMELLGRMPKSFTASGKHVKDFFNRKGELKRIRDLKFWNLEHVLVDKYHFTKPDAVELASFLEPMLRYEPAKRATAEQCLQYSWITGSGGEMPTDGGDGAAA